jgi:hypothetical protein
MSLHRLRKLMMAGTSGVAYAFRAKMAEKNENQTGCRPEIPHSDTVETATIPWPKEDRIRWVEWRVSELTVRAGQYFDERGRWLLEQKGAGGRKLRWGDEDEVTDYAVWLLKYRDELSWHQLAYRFFPTATEDHIEGQESKLRRAYNRVERKFKPARLSKNEKLILQAVMLGAVPLPIQKEKVEPKSEIQESAVEVIDETESSGS